MKLTVMKKKSENSKISAEMLAAYLDGNATAKECQMILNSLPCDNALRELMRISQCVDNELGIISDEKELDILPATALAATCDDGNRCCLECEKYILKKRGIPFEEQNLLRNAFENNWLKEEGTALLNIGRHLESFGLVVSRQYNCTIQSIIDALNVGDDVIVAVDEGELIGDFSKEFVEDAVIGQIPDHTLVVLSFDMDGKCITVYDPNSVNNKDVYPIDRFIDAWADSKNYLVTVNFKNMKPYKPSPIDLSDVVLTEDLNELREAIAENAHDIWAESRMAEGWTYGPRRDDRLKQTPDLVPYSQLSESEKEYDRKMAMRTIKLLKKLGYDLIKRNNTELYQILKQRILDSKQEYHCRRCGNVIYKHQIFCDKCGLELNIDWKEK